MNKKSLKEKGNGYYKDEDYAMAIAMYRKYVEKQHEDNKNAYYNMGLCYYKLERYDECVDICKQALKIDSNYTKVYYRIALAYEKLGKPYKCYFYANKFCQRSQSRKGEDFEEMKKLRDAMRDKIILPNPVLKEEKHYFFWADYQVNEGKAKKKEEKEGEEFKGYSWGDVERKLNKGEINEAINQGYGISRKVPNGDVKMRLNKQNMKILKEVKKGSLGLPITLKDENQIKCQLSLKEEGINIVNLMPMQQKQNKQPILSDLNQKSLEQESRVSLYQKYFLVPLQRKIDLFQGFFSTLLQITENKQILLESKQKILSEAKESYPMFQVLQMSLSEKQKKELKRVMEGNMVSPPLVRSYCE